MKRNELVSFTVCNLDTINEINLVCLRLFFPGTWCSEQNTQLSYLPLTLSRSILLCVMILRENKTLTFYCQWDAPTCVKDSLFEPIWFKTVTVSLQSEICEKFAKNLTATAMNENAKYGTLAQKNKTNIKSSISIALCIHTKHRPAMASKVIVHLEHD